jgi:HlyD family secretion protein
MKEIKIDSFSENFRNKILTRRNILAALAILMAFFILRGIFSLAGGSSNFKTAKIQRGNLFVSVSATGTLEPEEVVDIGAQVAGQIESFGKDRDGKTIDYGSQVDAGSLLAHIDESLYAADVAAADAQLKRANADLMQMQAKLLAAEQNWNRAQKLGPSDALSKSSYESYKAEFDVAKANVVVADAAIVQAQAALTRAQRNLDYCTIKSPVSGVVIDRRVNIGQTVVSSLNAPSLFLLAKDLNHMQVWVAVNEADVAKIHPGQAAAFSVDSYPGETFKGTVRKIRLNATMTQNIVTYIVEVSTDNSNGRLLPYLTANVHFEVSNQTDVLLVPNAALRWTPKVKQISSEFRDKFKPSAEKAADNTPKKGTIWVPDGSFVRPIEVAVGDTDNSVTAVEGGGIDADSPVVIGEKETAQNTSQQGSNPLIPQPMRGKGR